MALIVEDGSVVADAESYVSVVEATAYHAAMGNAAWAALTTEQREQNLRAATAYMLQVYRPLWAGYRYTAGQRLDWPRAYVPIRDSLAESFVDHSTVPLEVRQACAQLALRAASGSLLPDLAQGKVRVKVGPIETEYDRFSSRSPRYPAIEGLLTPYFKRAGGVQVLRA